MKKDTLWYWPKYSTTNFLTERNSWFLKEIHAADVGMAIALADKVHNQRTFHYYITTNHRSLHYYKYMYHMTYCYVPTTDVPLLHNSQPSIAIISTCIIWLIVMCQLPCHMLLTCEMWQYCGMFSPCLCTLSAEHPSSHPSISAMFF